MLQLPTVAHALVRAASPLVATLAVDKMQALSQGVETSLDTARTSARATPIAEGY